MPDIGERKLATVRRVAKIEPIEGADRIVKATIDGWELITQKGNYVPGDLCLYFEVDSFLPVREEFEFLRKGCFKSTTNLGDGFRIKTMKMRGQVSQGLSLPLKDFFQQEDDGTYYYSTQVDGIDTMPKLEEGMDLTEYFGVQKWEKPITGPGGSRLGPMHARGSFPSFLHKTDEERAQNCLAGVLKWIYYGKPEVTEVVDPAMIALLVEGRVENTADSVYFRSGDQWFHKYWLRNDEETIAQRRTFEVTLKLDGSSMTVYHSDYSYGVCSRNWDLKRDDDSVFWRVARSSKLLDFLVSDGKDVAVQGELMGPGVQGNRESLATHGFYVFNVFDIGAQRYMTPDERTAWFLRATRYCSQDLDRVPDPIIHDSYVSYVSLGEDVTIQDLLRWADTKSMYHPVAEGLVFKSALEGGPSFKVVNTKYLLEEE